MPRWPKRTVEERFWSHVKRAGPDECWLWEGATQPYGYGCIRINGKAVRSHRYAYQITHELAEEPPPHVIIMHRCDNPPCCNPAHLEAGTQKKNTLDMVARGRRTSPPLRGEINGRAKLTDDMVRQIRASDLPCARWAEKFGVSITLIHRVRQRKCWKHID